MHVYPHYLSLSNPTKRGKRPLAQQNKKRKIKWSRLILLLTLLAFLMGAGAATGLVAISVRDMPAFDPAHLVPINATRIYDKDNNLVTKIGVENRTAVSINEVPDVVKKAFLAAEDHNFYNHHGISIRGMFRAAWNDILHRDIVQGGSTITQQLVKLSFLSPEKKFKRKIQEILLAFKLERRYSKDEILEMYLNKIYLGEGAYGVQAAAQTYFNKDIQEIISLNEAATLAALPKAPSAYSPFQNYEGAKSRRNLILDNMVEYGFASKEAVLKAKQEEIPLRKGEPEKSRYPYPYFIDYVINVLVQKYGEDKVFKGGLEVYTSLDPKIQAAAEKAMSDPNNFPASKKDANGIVQPQGAMVVLDPSNGAIRAIVGGREHSHKRGLNRATRPRQPGSTFKPIIAYGPAIDLRGMAPASVIDDVPVNYGKYTPHNYDGRYRGLITMRTAVAYSVNIVAVKTLMDHVGIPDAIKFARKLGINLKAQNHGPAMALGGLYHGVTPIQMAGAYAAFANQGLYNKPTVIMRVESPDGMVLEEYDPSPVQAMKPTTAYLITDMLRSVVTSGTGTRANFDPERDIAGKTGTTEDGRDIWWAGYTPDLVGVVWIGYDEPTPMSRAYGGTYPAQIWKEVMIQAHEDIPKNHFRKPSGIVTATVDSKSGLLPGPNTPDEHMITDIFARGTEPTEMDNVHVLVEVCPISGKLPTDYCPDRITKVMLKLPYEVPEKVEDYELRVPKEICDMHGPGNWIFPGDQERPGSPEDFPSWENTEDLPPRENDENNGNNKKPPKDKKRPADQDNDGGISLDLNLFRNTE